MKVAFELERKRAASATSCGVPLRFRGATSTYLSSLDTFAVIGVLKVDDQLGDIRPLARRGSLYQTRADSVDSDVVL